MNCRSGCMVPVHWRRHLGRLLPCRTMLLLPQAWGWGLRFGNSRTSSFPRTSSPQRPSRFGNRTHGSSSRRHSSILGQNMLQTEKATPANPTCPRSHSSPSLLKGLASKGIIPCPSTFQVRTLKHIPALLGRRCKTRRPLWPLG